ncbi:hypothetical protein [Breoghania sp.]|uniref:Tc toxin subunit A-related protein n=1 Tax=Breoghania sp. TaxID=2065378 RepID=UPI00260B4555|nr:hypothetical protein [Breoghania sp.]MDJ0933687.1 hypothetical protein [Breoghania sp.]
MSLRDADYEEEDEKDSLVDFITVLRSAKDYVANLKTTSSRLLAAKEKTDSTRMAITQKGIDRDKIRRAAALQDLEIQAAEKAVDISRVALIGAETALAQHVGTILVAYGTMAMAANLRATALLLKLYSNDIHRKVTLFTGRLKAVLANIYGAATGRQRPSLTDVIDMRNQIADLLDDLMRGKGFEKRQESREEFLKLAGTAITLSTDIDKAKTELKQAKVALNKQVLSRKHLDEEMGDLDKLTQTASRNFAMFDFYNWLVTDLEFLFAEEWSVTQEFCRLLVRLYKDETGETNGAGFLRTTTLGNEYEQLNAPYRLALDLERLEAAYVRFALDQQGLSTSFALSEVSTVGSNSERAHRTRGTRRGLFRSR